MLSMSVNTVIVSYIILEPSSGSFELNVDMLPGMTKVHRVRYGGDSSEVEMWESTTISPIVRE